VHLPVDSTLFEWSSARRSELCITLTLDLAEKMAATSEFTADICLAARRWSRGRVGELPRPAI
jgi:hypothetical protein